jgi:hypothetical protein
VRDHVLLPLAGELEKADSEMKKVITAEKIKAIIDVLPGEWLKATFDEPVEKVKEVYGNYLATRLASSHTFVNAALDARKQLI